ncbi:MAG: large-conductance mechanosensitive channel protein MscL [Planctomycetes bacterium]|nr:large-conductance mechanosensitive channel protein MscL [Planctomycetota bacterium]
MISEFRKFIQRGNVVDLAVGLIMGGAFTKIVNSLVADVLMPPIGYIIGGVKFTELKFTLPEKEIRLPDPVNLGQFVTEKLPPATINYGQFLQTTFDFLVIAFCVFLMIKAMNELQKRIDRGEVTPAAPPPPTTTEKLLTEIRDLLQQPGSAVK